MPRLLIALACLALVAGCKKETPPEAPPPQAEEAAEAPEPAEEEAPAPEEKKLAIDEDAVKRYLAYWEEELAISRAALEGIGKEAEKLEKDKGVVNSVQAMNQAQEIGDKAERDRAALMKKHGFTEAHVGDLQELMIAVSTARRAAKNNPFAEMKKQLESVPKEQRAEAEKQFNEMSASFEAMANAQDAREKFGDAAVDAAIKHEAKILELTDKTFGLLK